MITWSDVDDAMAIVRDAIDELAMKAHPTAMDIKSTPNGQAFVPGLWARFQLDILESMLKDVRK